MDTTPTPGSEHPAPERRRLRWIPRPPRFVRRGWRFFSSRPLILAGMVAIVAAGVTFSGTQALVWMETPEFCGQCHTMTPQVGAHEESAHAGVECASCHVGAGLVGLAKAKIGGMRQMLEIILGDYARPIPPAAEKMPPASETCERCHDPGRGRSDVLITRSHYLDDAANTQQSVGIVLRLSTDGGKSTEGIHWHVLSSVRFATAADGSIPWIRVEKTDGTTEEFIQGSTVEMSSQAGEKAATFKAGADVHEMSCYDCHNRVGHDFPAPAQAIDLALSKSEIDPAIPYIKKRGVELVTARYESVDAFDQALRGLEQQYWREYPYLFLERPEAVQRSFAVLRDVYRKADHPAMNAEAKDYPNLLGHTGSVGCFRCHDGGHFKIVGGQLTKNAIPSACSTCHTFPSVGQAALAPIGQPPTSHGEKLWVFKHKDATGAKDGTAGVCASCHAQSYCTNCHASGVKNIKHDEMLVNHANVVRQVGQDACSACHQKPFCTRCHTKGIPQAN